MTESPRSSSSSTTHPPMKPRAPVTRTFIPSSPRQASKCPAGERVLPTSRILAADEWLGTAGSDEISRIGDREVGDFKIRREANPVVSEVQCLLPCLGGVKARRRVAEAD